MLKTITSEQKDILSFIVANEDKIKEILAGCNTAITGINLHIGDQIEVAGITWSKFAEDENGNAYMLADEAVSESEFGDNNDYRNSKIRKDLAELSEKIIAEISEDAIVPAEIDLFSHDGLDDYGKITDKVSLLTYDMYRNNRKNIKLLDTPWWLATPDSTPSGYGSGCVRYVGSDGGVDYCRFDFGKAVRPFFILKS